MRNENRISILDLSTPDTLNKANASELFLQATAECGFMYIRISDEDTRIVDTVRKQQTLFFDLTQAQKKDIAIDQNNRGYLGPGEALMPGAKRADQKEVFFWGREAGCNDPDYLADVPLCGPNQWPTQLPDFRTTIEQYSKMIEKQGSLMLSIIAIALGQSADYFIPYYKRTMLRGQLLKYPPTGQHQDQFGVAPHSDFGCITLLHQETEGLEIQFPNGSWVPAPPIKNTLVVNIGDLLERWSNNRLPSTKHRVRNTSVNARYSIAMFYDPSPLATVDPTDLLPNEPPQFEAIAASEYILLKNKKSFAHYKK